MLKGVFNNAIGYMDIWLDAISSAKEMADPPALTENARNWRSDEARKELASLS